MKQGKQFFSVIILIFLIVSLSGCLPAGSNDTNSSMKGSNRIALTTDNANYYLNISAKSGCTDYSNGHYESVSSSLSVTGANSSFIYENVRILIRVDGTVLAGVTQRQSRNYTYSHNLSCNLNAGGNGSDYDTDTVYYLTSYKTMYGWSTSTPRYSIVSISGYVITN